MEGVWVQHEAWKIYSAYAIGILVAVIIGLLSGNLGSVAGLSEKLNFAVGLASLILAIIAIVGSLIAAGDNTRTLVRIGDAAGAVSAAVDQLKMVSGKLASDTEIVATIPAHLKTLDDRVSEATGKIGSGAGPAPSTPSSPPDFSKTNAVSGNTWGGALCLYICCRAIETKKSFSASDVSGGNLERTKFLDGYISSLWYFKTLEMTRSKDGVYEIFSTYGMKSSKVLKDIKTLSKQEYFNETIPQVDAYFA